MKGNLVLTPWTTDNAPARVKAILAALHRTQAQLADVLGVSFATVNRWCNGKTVPDSRSRVMLEKLEATYVKKEDSAE